jgi:hypothetical protein
MNRRVITLAIAAAALIAFAASAIATAAVYGPGIPTRPQYVSKAEKLCGKTDKKMAKLTAAASKDARAGDGKGAGKKFGQVAAAFNKGVAQLNKLPKPTADRGLLNRWLNSMRGDVVLLKGQAKAYRAADGAKLAKLVKAASKHGAKTNAIVNGFGFNSCLVAS